jgi:hypothetical protein
MSQRTYRSGENHLGMTRNRSMSARPYSEAEEGACAVRPIFAPIYRPREIRNGRSIGVHEVEVVR